MLEISGIFEDVAEICHIINHSRKQQRSVTITLINLRSDVNPICSTLSTVLLNYCIVTSVYQLSQTTFVPYTLL